MGLQPTPLLLTINLIPNLSPTLEHCGVFRVKWDKQNYSTLLFLFHYNSA